MHHCTNPENLEMGKQSPFDGKQMICKSTKQEINPFVFPSLYSQAPWGVTLMDGELPSGHMVFGVLPCMTHSRGEC